MDGFDPYRVLHVNKKFTLEELKSSYKREVLKHHPDKTIRIVSTPQFQILTACYKILLNEYDQRTSQREFVELKQNYARDNNRGSAVVWNKDKDKEKEREREKSHMATAQSLHGDKFNVSRFNEDFEKHRFRDSTVEGGYSDWMSKTVNGEHVIKPKVDTHAVAKYKDPLPFTVGGGAYYPLGQDKIDDYSADNINAKDLHYMDFKLAHTTERIIDPDRVKKRREFQSVQELESYREAQMRRPVTEADMARQRKQELVKEKKEQERLAKLTEYNRLIDEFHQKTHTLLLAGQGK